MSDNLIEMNCPNCNAPIAFHSKDSGFKGKCPECNAHFIIPAIISQSQTIHKIDASDLPSPSLHKHFSLPVDHRSSCQDLTDMFCPGCHKLLSFDHSDVWNKGLCPACGSYFTITEPDYLAKYFAEVKSGSVTSDEYDYADSSNAQMCSHPINRTNGRFRFPFDLSFDSFLAFLKMYFLIFGIVLVALFFLYGIVSEIAPAIGFHRIKEPSSWSFFLATSGLGVPVSLYFLIGSLVAPLAEDSYVRKDIEWGIVFSSCASLLFSIMLFITFIYLSSL